MAILIFAFMGLLMYYLAHGREVHSEEEQANETEREALEAEAKARELHRQRDLAEREIQKQLALAEQARISARAASVLDQLPNTKAFRKVTLDDAFMAVHCVDEASRVIEHKRADYLKAVDDLFYGLAKDLKHKEHVVDKMIGVQGLNLRTGKVLGSEDALRADIQAEKDKRALEAQERRSKWKKCVSCQVQHAFLKDTPPIGPWDVTHCSGCAVPDVHVYSFAYPERHDKRVRLENVKPYKHACASLV